MSPSPEDQQSLLAEMASLRAELERDLPLKPPTAFEPVAGPRERERGLRLARELFAELGCDKDEELASYMAELFSAIPEADGSAVQVIGAHKEKVVSVFQRSVVTGNLADKAKQLLGMVSGINKNALMKPWCDVVAIANAVGAITAGGNEGLSDDDKNYLRFLKKIDQSGLLRERFRVPAAATVMELVARFPNFAGPATFIAEQLALARLRRDASVRLPPILLTGPAGAGKTHFAMALAAALGTRSEVLSMASQSCGFTISGMDRGWSAARPGLVFDAIFRGPGLSPLIVLDEIDKTQPDGKSDPLGPLYTLLEPNSSKAFRDEFAGFPIDASQVIWIATANDAGVLPGPLASRFVTFEVGLPTPDHLALIAEGIFEELAQGVPVHPNRMPAGWSQRLAKLSIRGIRLALQQALGKAALRADGRGNRMLVLQDSDLQIGGEAPRQRMGFY